MASDEKRGSKSDRAFGSSHQDNMWTIEAMPAGLLDEPLEFIFAEHHRQREAALILVLIADGEYDRRGVADLIQFLESDFALHVGDEELAFFPILKQQCRPEDNIDALIKRLSDEHKDDEQIGDEALALLRGVVNGKNLSEDDKRLLRAFAEHIRQHLAVENAVLLPIARLRMDDDALKAFSDRLKARRRL